MTNVTKIAGVVLIVLGALGTALGVATDTFHITALAPAVLGVAILIAGIVAGRISAHQHAIHAALVLALLGALASIRQLVALLGGDFGAGPVFGTLTIVVCGAYVAMGVRSFVAARKAREASTS